MVLAPILNTLLAVTEMDEIARQDTQQFRLLGLADPQEFRDGIADTLIPSCKHMLEGFRAMRRQIEQSNDPRDAENLRKVKEMEAGAERQLRELMRLKERPQKK